MKELNIMGISIDNRKQMAPKVQEVLTKYGENIISRVGTHDPGEQHKGLITLHIMSAQDTLQEFSNELSSLDGVTVKLINMK